MSQQSSNPRRSATPCLRARTESFWQWFLAQESDLQTLSHTPESIPLSDQKRFLSAGSAHLGADCKLLIDRENRLGFSPCGGEHLFYLLPHIAAAAPAELTERWKIEAYPSGSGAENFAFEIFGFPLFADKLLVHADYDRIDATFRISFYHECLRTLPARQTAQSIQNALERSLGAGFFQVYVRSVELARAPSDRMFPLTKLRARMASILSNEGCAICTRPDRRRYEYTLTPRLDPPAPRYDLISGKSCCMSLVSAYYDRSTTLCQKFLGWGAYAAFLFFPYQPTFEHDRIRKFCKDLEERLHLEVLDSRNLGKETGLVLGTAVGSIYAYIDLLLFDASDFLQRVPQVLASYSEPFYLMEFHQSARPVRLTGRR